MTHARDEYNWDFNNDKIRNLLIKLLNGKEWAEAKLTKNVNKDICIIKHNPKAFKIAMKPIEKFKSFKKLKSFVRAMGSQEE